MITPKITTGIVPGDILIKTAIEAGLNDLRNNPFLLDYCFGWTVSDELTKEVYGEKERQKAKAWFLNNEIFVTMNFRIGDPKFPCISIALDSSSEAEVTLADVNDVTQEDVESQDIEINQKPIVGPFTPKSYDPQTGKVVLPDDIGTSIVFENMVLVDSTTNTGYKILDVIDDTTIQITPNTNANFSKAFISAIDNFYVSTIESCYFRQNYTLRCLAEGDAIYALYLEQILLFILMRYKEVLLEARGFERSTPSVGPLHAFKDTDLSELTWARDVSLSGYVRHYWPKLISPKIQGFVIDNIKIIGGGITPDSIAQEVMDQGWETESF